MQAPAEVLDVGRDRRGLSPRGRRVLVGLLAVLVVAGLVGWRVDAAAREREERAVAECEEAALRADERAAQTLGFMVRHIEPALYVVPAGPRRDGLVTLVADAAERSLPPVRRALAVCRETSVAWLHRGLAEQRAAYVDYLEARVRRLEEVAADGHTYYRDQPQLAALRRAAFDS